MTDYLAVSQAASGAVTATLYLDREYVQQLTGQAISVSMDFLTGGQLCSTAAVVQAAAQPCPAAMNWIFNQNCYSVSCTSSQTAVKKAGVYMFSASFKICPTSNPNCWFFDLALSDFVTLNAGEVPMTLPPVVNIPSPSKTTTRQGGSLPTTAAAAVGNQPQQPQPTQNISPPSNPQPGFSSDPNQPGSNSDASPLSPTVSNNSDSNSPEATSTSDISVLGNSGDSPKNGNTAQPTVSPGVNQGINNAGNSPSGTSVDTANNYLTVFIGMGAAVVVVVFAILGFVVVRRRREEDDEGEVKTSASNVPPQETVNTVLPPYSAKEYPINPNVAPRSWANPDDTMVVPPMRSLKESRRNVTASEYLEEFYNVQPPIPPAPKEPQPELPVFTAPPPPLESPPVFLHHPPLDRPEAPIPSVNVTKLQQAVASAQRDAVVDPQQLEQMRVLTEQIAALQVQQKRQERLLIKQQQQQQLLLAQQQEQSQQSVSSLPGRKDGRRLRRESAADGEPQSILKK